MADFSTSVLAVRGCNIRLMRGGAGRPLLFCTARGGANWLPFMAAGAAFDVIVPEHPGFGASDTPDWLDTIPDLANFYLDFLDQLDLKDVDLVGLSLGGWIAAELAVRNTQRLASLTLAGAAGIHVKASRRSIRSCAATSSAPRLLPRSETRRRDRSRARCGRSSRTSS